MHARALEPGADHYFATRLHHPRRGAEALFVEFWISHAVSIVPDVADTFPGLFVLAGMAMQRLHKGFQAALIEFLIARPDPRFAFWAVPINDLSHLAEMFFDMKAVENLSGLWE
jgi:hypothetical protein